MVAVGIGELYVTKDTSLVLAAYGLGSCVGVSVYDPAIKAGGLAHVLLPSSAQANQETSGNRFADVAVPSLVQKLLDLGAKRKHLICKIAGGAQTLVVPGHSNGFRIGERNVEAVREALRILGIVPSALDTGGSRGRTVRLFMDTGKVFVRIVGKEDVEL